MIGILRIDTPLRLNLCTLLGHRTIQMNQLSGLLMLLRMGIIPLLENMPPARDVDSAADTKTVLHSNSATPTISSLDLQRF